MAGQRKANQAARQEALATGQVVPREPLVRGREAAGETEASRRAGAVEERTTRRSTADPSTTTTRTYGAVAASRTEFRGGQVPCHAVDGRSSAFSHYQSSASVRASSERGRSSPSGRRRR